jgi:hypothetical protein
MAADPMILRLPAEGDRRAIVSFEQPDVDGAVRLVAVIERYDPYGDFWVSAGVATMDGTLDSLPELIVRATSPADL